MKPYIFILIVLISKTCLCLTSDDNVKNINIDEKTTANNTTVNINKTGVVTFETPGLVENIFNQTKNKDIIFNETDVSLQDLISLLQNNTIENFNKTELTRQMFNLINKLNKTSSNIWTQIKCTYINHEFKCFLNIWSLIIPNLSLLIITITYCINILYKTINLKHSRM